MIDLQTLLTLKPVLFDGALGTELQKAGLPLDIAPEIWNIERPEEVIAVHKKYAAAGCDVITANSFGANKIRMDLAGISISPYKLNLKAAELAKKAADQKCFIAGSVGPTGKLFGVHNELPDNDLLNIFIEQISGLKDGGVDFILIETMTQLSEALIALKAAKNLEIPLIAVSFSFHISSNEIRTYLEDKLESCIDALSQNGADLIAANCGNSFDEMKIVLERIKQLTTKPVLVQPNAGLPKIENGRIKYNLNVDDYKEFVKFALKNKVECVGGCCGTDPTYIKAAYDIISK